MNKIQIGIQGKVVEIHTLTAIQLYQAGSDDASCMGSPQCEEPDYLAGWDAYCDSLNKHIVEDDKPDDDFVFLKFEHLED